MSVPSTVAKCPVVPVGACRWAYRDYVIVYEPPPIPLRNSDYQWRHVDYDPTPTDSYGPPGDHRAGASASLALAMTDIDEQIEEFEAAQ
jgi:hypothetical protein